MRPPLENLQSTVMGNFQSTVIGMRWYCGRCHFGPMTIGSDHYCFHCARAMDPPPPPSIASSGRSANKADISKAQPTSEGASQKSGIPVHTRRDVTPKESSVSLSKIAKHAGGAFESELPLGDPVDET